MPELPIDPLDAARLKAAMLELNLNTERLELLTLQKAEEERRRPVLEQKVHSLIDDLHRKMNLSKLSSHIDLEREVIICQNKEDSE